LETRFTVARKSTYEDAAVEAEKRLKGEAFKNGNWDRIEVAYKPQVRHTDLKGTFVIDFVRDGVAGAPGVPTYEAA
jgi:hypothetical protein